MQPKPDPSETDPLNTLEPPPLSPGVMGTPHQQSTGQSWTVGTLTYTRAGLAILFCLLLWGDFAWSMKERSAAPILQILIKDFHASDSEMQLFMVVIPSAIGVLLGPVISYRSDRHRGRWGRRIPYLLMSTPFAVLAMIGLGYSPAMGQSLHNLLGSHSLGLDASIRLLFGVFWVIFEVATVSANAVFGGLINDVVPKPLLGRFYGFFRALSLIAGMAFNYQLLGHAEAHYQGIFWAIGLLYGVGFTLMCLTVKEGQYPPPQTEGSGADRPGLVNATRVYLRECFSHPYYLWLMGSIVLGSITFLPVNNFSQPFAKSLGINNDILGKYLFVTYAISLLLAYFLGSLADRFHPLRIGIAAMLLYAIVSAWGEFYSAKSTVLFTVNYTVGKSHQSVPVHLFAIALIAHGVISGTFFTCTASLGQRLFPHERFAQFASAGQSLISISQIALGYWSGKFFDHHGQIYQHTYGMGFILAVLAAISMLIVHTQFMRFGGVKNYVAPGHQRKHSSGFPVV